MLSGTSAANAATSDPTLDVAELVRQALPLVGHTVRDMLTRVPGHVQREDLMSAGMLGLVQAAKAFDADRGVSFAGYAATRIRGAIVDELRSLDWASRSVRRRARQVDEARNTLAVSLGRVPTNPEVASALGLGLDELAAHEEDLSRASVMSLDGYDDTTLGDVLPSGGPTPVDVLEQREKIAYLQDAVVELPERLRLVVQGYFYDDLPMADLAEQLGCHRVPDLAAARRSGGAAARRARGLAGPAARGEARAPGRLCGPTQGGVLRQRRRPPQLRRTPDRHPRRPLLRLADIGG